MRSVMRRALLLFVAGAVLAVPQLGATTLLQMDLGELTQRAERIFRGTVVDVIPGTMSAGGGEFPTTTYVLKVEESFKGDADLVKGDISIIEVRMVGSIKGAPVEGDEQRFDTFRDVPRLTMGGDYLLFTTRASAIGLSTTVGLGQGAFTVFSQDKEDFAVNEFNNGGLGFDQAGPISYSEITAKILALLGQ